MPWKLISFIICIVLVTVFVGFNLDNRCNISFGFIQFENVPIFLSLAAAFILGVLVVFPFTIGKRRLKDSSSTKKNKETQLVPAKTPASSKEKKLHSFEKKSGQVVVSNQVASVPESSVTKENVSQPEKK